MTILSWAINCIDTIEVCSHRQEQEQTSQGHILKRELHACFIADEVRVLGKLDGAVADRGSTRGHREYECVTGWFLEPEHRLQRTLMSPLHHQSNSIRAHNVSVDQFSLTEN